MAALTRLRRLYCGLFVVLFCLPFGSSNSSDVHKDGNHTPRISATRICKPGPRLEQSETKKECLIIGDSVCIGYTPWVRSAIEDMCQVFHAPWDTTNGGALDTKYAVKCLKFFLSTALLNPVRYDAIIFNFGLHDVEYNGQYPEEYTNETLYRSYLNTIKGLLIATGDRVGYVLTTPVPYSTDANHKVKKYNAIAREVMEQGVAIDVADLYNWVVLVCGKPPYKQCGIALKQPSVHYTSQGYKYLSVMVAGLLRQLLKKTETEKYNGSQWEDNKDATTDLKSASVPCKGSSGEVVTVCPANTTCVPCRYSGSHWGCCLLRNAVYCKDGKHCCPEGYECDPQCNVSRCTCTMPGENTLT